jgi:hypothetical protein
MKKSLLILSFGLLLVFAACSTTSVRFDYERGVDFSQFKTFDFYPVPESLVENPLVIKRIGRAIIAEMESKGLTHDESADLLIAIHTDVKDKINVTSYGYGYAPYYRYGYWGGGHGGTTVSQYEEGTLIIDIVDNNEDELIWRGEASKALPSNPTPQQIDGIIDEVVTKIMANYPPSGK